MRTNEIINIIKKNNIKYFSFRCEMYYGDIIYFLTLYKHKYIKYAFESNKFEIQSNKEQINAIMQSIYGRKKSMMSDVWYEI